MKPRGKPSRQTRALNGDRHSAHLLLHLLERAKLRVNGCGQRTRRQREFAWRAEVCPEDGMVEVAAAVELNGALGCDHCSHVTRSLGEKPYI